MPVSMPRLQRINMLLSIKLPPPPCLQLFHNSERLEKTALGGGAYGRSTFAPHHESRQLQVYSDVGSSTPSVGEVSRSSGSLSNSDGASSSGVWGFDRFCLTVVYCSF